MPERLEVRLRRGTMAHRMATVLIHPSLARRYVSGESNDFFNLPPARWLLLPLGRLISLDAQQLPNLDPFLVPHSLRPIRIPFDTLPSFGE